MGLKDVNFGSPAVSPCQSLRSLSSRRCPGFGNVGLALLGKLCPQLEHVDFNGLKGIIDAGFLPLVENCEAGLLSQFFYIFVRQYSINCKQ
ncbi:EIN3-binding F-box protein 1-like [Pyrus ussuriensis x Pyrus communis]|uniref:EIN3-binding F-box protein 1-like n=1 Tax=Pyrus ussuriensis x Pyrus communis TaxID=2448454 RepID=A0A5N5H192_9ROSA|nr:EIN3-binding F-box protein 1-like [Pyrus ussuriensis x Pyrus communis]